MSEQINPTPKPAAELVTAKVKWAELLKSGNRLFIGSNVAVPNALVDSLIDDGAKLKDLEIVHIGTISQDKWADEAYKDRFKINTFFINGEKIRKAVDEGRADYTPCFLSEVSGLFNDGTLPLDAALVMVSSPDELGYCSLGVSVDITFSAARAAKHIIAQINPNMPRVCGQTFLHMSEFSACIEHPQLLPEDNISETNKKIERIGQYVSLLIENGSTLQLGIGKIPNAVTHYLHNHTDLGVHSEMISDGIMDLMRRGVVNNRAKTFHPGKTVASFCIGTDEVYRFIHNNPHIEFYPSSYINKSSNIARNHKMISVNSALEVDLGGQVVSDSIGFKFYSGIGGQVDFVTGASKSKGGKSIIAMPSTAKNGCVSRIVPHITQGSGVVTSRGNVQYVVTEFGIANLKGKSIRERALELIRVAHPKFRESLLKEIREEYWVPNHQKRHPTDIPELGDIQLKPIIVDGKTFYLRALNPSDERRLQEFFYSHTKETIRMRYNAEPSAMSREKSCDLVSVDQRQDVAITVVDQEGSKTIIEAVGRYYFYPASNMCEVAFVTRENFQGKGLAKRLLQTMIEIASTRGIKQMYAVVKGTNKAMLSVFESFGFKRALGDDPLEIELFKQLDSPPE